MTRSLGVGPIALVCAALCGGIFVFAVALAAWGQEVNTDHSFVLYAGPRGSSPNGLRFSVKVGPFSSAFECYAMGALIVDDLSTKHTNRDFLGDCGDGRFDLEELAARAKRLMEEKPQ